MTFLHVASSGLTKTFRSASRLKTDVFYLVALSALMNDLVQAVGVSSIVEEI